MVVVTASTSASSTEVSEWGNKKDLGNTKDQAGCLGGQSDGTQAKDRGIDSSTKTWKESALTLYHNSGSGRRWEFRRGRRIARSYVSCRVQ